MKTNYYLLLALYSLALFSCDLLGRIDDIKPDYVLVDKTVISDEKTAEASLNGAYSSLRKTSIGWLRCNLKMILKHKWMEFCSEDNEELYDLGWLWQETNCWNRILNMLPSNRL